MRVLLAGSTGVIGAELRRQLVAAGHEVTGVARAESADLSVDILDREALLRAVDGLAFDGIVHQATALRQPGSMHLTNRLRTEGTSALLAVARETGAKRFVTASAFYGYGTFDHGDEPLDESVPFAMTTGSRIDPVQMALASNEQQVRSFGGIALRYGLVYGRPAPVIARGWHGSLPLLHPADAASAAVAALSRGRRGAAYNIADEVPASWAELQRALAVAAGSTKPRPVPPRALKLAFPLGGGVAAGTSMRLTTLAARRGLRWKPRYPSYLAALAAQVDVAAPA